MTKSLVDDKDGGGGGGCGRTSRFDPATVAIAVAASTMALAGVAFCVVYVVGFAGVVQVPVPVGLEVAAKIGESSTSDVAQAKQHKRSLTDAKAAADKDGGLAAELWTESADDEDDDDDYDDYDDSRRKDDGAGDGSDAASRGSDEVDDDVEDVYGKKKRRKTTLRPAPTAATRTPLPPAPWSGPTTARRTTTTGAVTTAWTSTRTPPTTVTTRRPTTVTTPTPSRTSAWTSTRTPPTTATTRRPTTVTTPTPSRTSAWTSTTARPTTTTVRRPTTTHGTSTVRPTTPTATRTTHWTSRPSTTVTPTRPAPTTWQPVPEPKAPAASDKQQLPIDLDLVANWRGLLASDYAAISGDDLDWEPVAARDQDAFGDGDELAALPGGDELVGGAQLRYTGWIPRGP